MDDFTGFMFCMFLVFIATWTCANGRIHPESFHYAEKVCEQHGGLKFLDEDKTRFSTAVCNNGLNISYNNSKVGKSK